MCVSGDKLFACASYTDCVRIYRWWNDRFEYEGDVKLKRKNNFHGIQVVGSTLYTGDPDKRFVKTFKLDFRSNTVLDISTSHAPDKWFGGDRQSVRVCDRDDAGNILVCSSDANFVAVLNAGTSRWSKVWVMYMKELKGPVDVHFSHDASVYVLHGDVKQRVTEFILV